jgi:hypothetical protein
LGIDVEKKCPVGEQPFQNPLVNGGDQLERVAEAKALIGDCCVYKTVHDDDGAIFEMGADECLDMLGPIGQKKEQFSLWIDLQIGIEEHGSECFPDRGSTRFLGQDGSTRANCRCKAGSLSRFSGPVNSFECDQEAFGGQEDSIFLNEGLQGGWEKEKAPEKSGAGMVNLITDQHDNNRTTCQ